MVVCQRLSVKNAALRCVDIIKEWNKRNKKTRKELKAEIKQLKAEVKNKTLSMEYTVVAKCTRCGYYNEHIIVYHEGKPGDFKINCPSCNQITTYETVGILKWNS